MTEKCTKRAQQYALPLEKSLGEDCIETRGTEELKLNDECIECDVFEFEEAMEKNEWNNALDLYWGKLLEGLHVPKASAELIQWLDTHRDHYHNEYLKAAHENSVAVLPFDVLGSHEATLQFARGLHNDLLTQLSANRQLSVISRTSVLRYEDSNQAIPEITRELRCTNYCLRVGSADRKQNSPHYSYD